MSRNAHLIPQVKSLIAEIHIEHPDFGAKPLREELLSRMKRSGLDRNFGPNWPGISAVGKELKKIREKDMARTPNSKGLDKPWSMLSLAKYQLPPEALPFVLQVLAYCRHKADVELTVREVKWVAQLYAVYIDHPIRDIYEAAHAGAVHELMTELSDQPYVPDDAEMEVIMHLIDRPFGILKAIKKSGKWPLYDPSGTASVAEIINKEVNHERSHSKEE